MQLSPGLLASSAETKVGSRVEFSCEVAELSIVGAAAISCLHTGAWDHPVPACQHLNCPDILAVVKVSEHGPIQVATKFRRDERNIWKLLTVKTIVPGRTRR